MLVTLKKSKTINAFITPTHVCNFTLFAVKVFLILFKQNDKVN